MSDEKKISETEAVLEKVSSDQQSVAKDPNLQDEVAKISVAAEVTVEGEASAVSNVLEVVSETKPEVNGEEAGEGSKNVSVKRKLTFKFAGMKGIKSGFLSLFSNTTKPKKVEKVDKEVQSVAQEVVDKKGTEPTKDEKVDNGKPEASLVKVEVSVSVEPESIVKAETPAQKEAPAAEVATVQAILSNLEVEEKPKEEDTVPEIRLQADITPEVNANPTEAPSAADNQNSEDIGNLLEDAINHDPLDEEKKRASGESFDKLDDVPQPSEEKAKAKDSSSEEFIEVNQNQES